MVPYTCISHTQAYKRRIFIDCRNFFLLFLFNGFLAFSREKIFPLSTAIAQNFNPGKKFLSSLCELLWANFFTKSFFFTLWKLLHQKMRFALLLTFFWCFIHFHRQISSEIPQNFRFHYTFLGLWKFFSSPHQFFFRFLLHSKFRSKIVTKIRNLNFKLSKLAS